MYFLPEAMVWFGVYEALKGVANSGSAATWQHRGCSAWPARLRRFSGLLIPESAALAEATRCQESSSVPQPALGFPNSSSGLRCLGAGLQLAASLWAFPHQVSKDVSKGCPLVHPWRPRTIHLRLQLFQQVALRLDGCELLCGKDLTCFLPNSLQERRLVVHSSCKFS